jgi:predicted HicB family RNase H-like nuclease
VKSYIANFDNEIWGKMKAIASLQGETITDWLEEKVEEDLNNVSIKSYDENKKYSKKKVRLSEKLHQKLKTKAYVHDCRMRDVIQSIIEKEINKAGF